ncbi:MAG: HAMP domain-containing protein [Pyrinomonadaceae bacterium]|nr:HAMP domain-containing protein [Pyrinomonadaceae bacterium]MBP6213391.1 HAMP domain-containing protein [Pyrinomonadaceae bacterium]
MLVLLHLFALFLLVTLGFYVFVANPRNRAHQTFAAFIAFLAFWTVKDLIFWNFYPVDRASGWWVAASFVIALLMQFAMVVFAWVFPENARTPRKRAAVLFAPAIFLFPAAAFGLLWHRAGFEDGRFVIDLSPLAYAFVVYVYFVFFYGAAILYGKYRRYRGTQEGQQVGAIIWGLAITGVLKTLANIVLPYLGYYELLPLSAIFVLPGVLIYAYAILNFQLFSLQSALKQFRLFPITYKVALSIATVAVVSFVLFQIPIAWWAFRHGMDYEAWRRYLVFSVISALIPNLLLVLLILRTISRPLQRLTLAAVEVAKGGYGTEVDLRRTNDEIGLLADSFNEMSRKMAADIDELQRLNAHLIRTEKLAAMGTLSAGVAHEVNNPLASISSLIQMMQTKDDLPDDARDKLKLISAQIKRITQVTTDMTNFARTRPAARVSVNVNKVVETAMRLASFDESFRRLDIVTDLGENVPAIKADADQIQQVALNLLLNARDAMPDGGTLAVSVSTSGGDVVITIADTGGGIEDTAAQHIFDPFFTTKPAGKGTGLGLAVCYGIVTAHGGRIEVTANDPTGTIFSVTLPVTGEN